jgi:hypothetical protein
MDAHHSKRVLLRKSVPSVRKLPIASHVLEEQRPERDVGSIRVGRVRGDGPAKSKHLHVGRDVRVECNFDDVIDPIRHERLDSLNDILTSLHDMMRASAPRDCFVRRAPDRRDHGRARTTGELQCADPDGTGAALHQHRSPVDRSSGVHTAMRGDAGNTQTRTLLE